MLNRFSLTVPDATGKQPKGTGTNQPKSDGEVTDQQNNAPNKPAVEDPKALMEKDLDELRKAIDGELTFLEYAPH